MSEIIMDHPHNGAHVVYNEHEAAEMAKKGWVKRAPKVAAPEVDAEALTETKKPGRKPKA